MAKKKKVYSSKEILEKYESPEIEIDGKTFRVASHLPVTMMANLTKQNLEEAGPDVMVDLMAKILGVSRMEIELLDLDIRVFRVIMEDIQQILIKQMEGAAKNPTGAGASSPK